MRNGILLLLMVPAVVSAEWYFEGQTDAFTDESRYFSSTPSTISSEGKLVVSYIDGRIDIVLKIGAHVTFTGYQGMRVMGFRYRIDKGGIVETDAFFLRGSFVIQQGEDTFKSLTPALEAGQILTAEITEPNVQSVQHHFSLKGSSAAIKKVVSACSS